MGLRLRTGFASLVLKDSDRLLEIFKPTRCVTRRKLVGGAQGSFVFGTRRIKKICVHRVCDTLRVIFPRGIANRGWLGTLGVKPLGRGQDFKLVGQRIADDEPGRSTLSVLKISQITLVNRVRDTA